MSNEEASQAYKVLSGELSERGYLWVLNQVEATINLGRITKANTLDYSPTDDLEATGGLEVKINGRVSISTEEESRKIHPNKKRKGRPVLIERVESYTPHERLIILLKAIEQTFVETSRMEISAIERLMKVDPKHVREAIVAFDQEEQTRNRPLTVSNERRTHVKSLHDGLAALRKAAR